MTVNLDKYKESILAAWKDVVDDKSSIDWALFSYDGQTNDLKVVSKGDGGIEEMREDLNSGKIMYAFCRVLDPKTSLYKFVLINWQGEGAPHHRKATSANHISDVSRVLKGFHVTVNARNEEEVDTDVITDKLSKAGSAYSFKDRGQVVRDAGPVGTTYKRVIPQQEINSNERDKFWQKEEEEEKKRQETERKRKDEEKGRLENEIKKREIEETVQREAKIKERSKSISVLREAERNEMLRINAGKISDGGDDIKDRENEEVERKTRSETLRRQRSQETQALISKRTIDARAVFEQNSAAGQLQQRRASYQPSVTVVKEKVSWPPTQPMTTHSSEEERQRISVVEQRNNEASVNVNGSGTKEPNCIETERAQPYVEAHGEDKGLDMRAQPYVEAHGEDKGLDMRAQPYVEAHGEDKGLDMRAQPYVEAHGEDKGLDMRAQPYVEAHREDKGLDLRAQPYVEAHGEDKGLDLRAQPYVEAHREDKGLDLRAQPYVEAHREDKDLDLRAQPYVEAHGEDEGLDLRAQTYVEAHGEDEGLDLRAQALYDYQAADETEISFDPGDIITRIDQIDAGWWQGLAPDGSYGLFPANYVQLLD